MIDISVIGYLIQQHWIFLLLALLIGAITGWLSCEPNENKE